MKSLILILSYIIKKCSICKLIIAQNIIATFSFRLNANFFALLLCFEPIFVTLAASVPEPRATTVIGIVKPLDRKVSAGAPVLLQTTRSTRHRRYGETTFEILPLSFLDSVRTASVLRCVAGASRKVWPLSWRSAVRTAFVLRVLASATCKHYINVLLQNILNFLFFLIKDSVNFYIKLHLIVCRLLP